MLPFFIFIVMKLITVPSYITVVCKVTDASNLTNDFTIAFKQLNKQTKKKLKKILSTLNKHSILLSILRTNIVFIDDILLSDSKLTDSFTYDIVDDVLDSLPYFNTILSAFLQYLNINTSTTGLIQTNLVELGKYQAELDYGIGNWQEKKKEEALLDEFSDYLNFMEDETSTVVQEVILAKLDKQLLLKENEKVFKIFLICRYWLEETNLPNANVIIELCKENKVSISSALTLIPIIYNSYYSNKPKEN